MIYIHIYMYVCPIAHAPAHKHRISQRRTSRHLWIRCKPLLLVHMRVQHKSDDECPEESDVYGEQDEVDGVGDIGAFEPLE